jgi:amidase
MTDVLGDLDATAIAERIRAKDFTAQEAAEAAIARIERLNPQLNFLATEAFDYGREQAARADRSAPFAGVPTLIKDLLPLAGLPTKFGCRGLANFQLPDQSPYADALLASGLAPLGKSTTPEFGLTATTEPLLGGATRNPWDLEKSCGGSSGGAASAVASGAVPIAHASDGGGSIRIPASCNGLVGLKVSRHRTIDARPLEVGVVLSVNGCVSRSVRDTAAFLAATEQSGAGAQLAPVGMVSGPSLQRLRIGFSIPDLRGRDPDADVAEAAEDAATLCRDLGHSVRQFKPPFDGDALAGAFTLVWAAIAKEATKPLREASGAVALDTLLEPMTIALVNVSQNAAPDALERAVAVLREVEAAYAALFNDIDVLLTPVLASTPPLIGEMGPAKGMDAFARAERYVGYTPLQNVAGAPAISLPLALSPRNGMPIGAHFAAAKGQERRLLELAYELEQAKPWSSRKPAVNAG